MSGSQILPYGATLYCKTGESHSMKHLSSPPSACRLLDPSVSPCRKAPCPPTEAEWINPVRSQPVLMSPRSLSMYGSVPVWSQPFRSRVLSDKGGKQGPARDGGSTFGVVDLLLNDKWTSESQCKGKEGPSGLFICNITLKQKVSLSRRLQYISAG